MKKRNLALLCDFGLDDAAATLYILENAEKFEKIDILPIGGNFPLLDSMVNAKRILTHFEKPLSNVRLVDTRVIKQNEEKLEFIHGLDGMGSVFPENYDENLELLPYSEWIKTLDENYTVVSLGPCTVTLDIMKKYPNLSLLLMAGNIAEPPNYNGYEFNHGMDDAAFDECVKFEHKIATLDTCHNEKCNFYKMLPKGDTWFEKVVRRSAELSKQRGEKGSYIYDLICVSYLLNPEKFKTEQKIDKWQNKLSVLKFVDENMLFEF